MYIYYSSVSLKKFVGLIKQKFQKESFSNHDCLSCDKKIENLFNERGIY